MHITGYGAKCGIIHDSLQSGTEKEGAVIHPLSGEKAMEGRQELAMHQIACCAEHDEEMRVNVGGHSHPLLAHTPSRHWENLAWCLAVGPSTRNRSWLLGEKPQEPAADAHRKTHLCLCLRPFASR